MLTLITGASAGLGAEMARQQVFEVFRRFAPLDRVIVNAGVGGAKIVGTGEHAHNLALARTNFVAALAQIEAAMEQFRPRGRGQLVVISSVAAMRGLRGSPAVYAATKRGIAHLAEGLRSEMLHSKLPITITTVYPGYIRSEMTADQTDAPFTVDTQTGVRAIVSGIETGTATVFAPRFPWQPLGLALRVLPLAIASKLTRPARGE